MFTNLFFVFFFAPQLVSLDNVIVKKMETTINYSGDSHMLTKRTIVKLVNKTKTSTVCVYLLYLNPQ